MRRKPTEGGKREYVREAGLFRANRDGLMQISFALALCYLLHLLEQGMLLYLWERVAQAERLLPWLMAFFPLNMAFVACLLKLLFPDRRPASPVEHTLRAWRPMLFALFSAAAFWALAFLTQENLQPILLERLGQSAMFYAIQLICDSVGVAVLGSFVLRQCRELSFFAKRGKASIAMTALAVALAEATTRSFADAASAITVFCRLMLVFSFVSYSKKEWHFFAVNTLLFVLFVIFPQLEANAVMMVTAALLALYLTFSDHGSWWRGQRDGGRVY